MCHTGTNLGTKARNSETGDMGSKNTSDMDGMSGATCGHGDISAQGAGPGIIAYRLPGTWVARMIEDMMSRRYDHVVQFVLDYQILDSHQLEIRSCIC